MYDIDDCNSTNKKKKKINAIQIAKELLNIKQFKKDHSMDKFEVIMAKFCKSKWIYSYLIDCSSLTTTTFPLNASAIGCNEMRKKYQENKRNSMMPFHFGI